MKNSCLWAVISLLALTACNDEKEVRVEAGPAENYPAEIHGTIKEYSAIADSKGISGSWADGEAIGITTAAGLSDMPNVATEDRNVKYVYSSTENSFLVDSPEGEDYTIYFKGLYDMKLYAYAPYTGQRGTIPGPVEIATTSEMQVEDRQAGIDFLYAESAGSQKSPKVEFLFYHKMCNVRLNFRPKNDDVQLSALDYKLKAMKLDGVFNPSTGQATLKEGAIPQDIEMHLAVSENMSSSLIFYPQTFSTSSVLEVVMGEKSYAVSPQTDINMEAGQVYVFDVMIGEQEMTINLSSIADWETGGEKYGIAGEGN
ncbi:fimbrillin family protein [uncultured Bacteroides sp.]|jgi:hypothetical protein|uniref:fimbrillin family protein n=1 Tax=uncultured Bacteroides sp. TaxID=162156 RepID=UPI00280B7F8A|nr:fimbrillin family protein [uncultured Bacteroides sp.]